MCVCVGERDREKKRERERCGEENGQKFSSFSREILSKEKGKEEVKRHRSLKINRQHKKWCEKSWFSIRERK